MITFERIAEYAQERPCRMHRNAGRTERKKMTELNRYSIISQKNSREIILLRGNGCKWRRCRFCDYHLDYSRDEEENFRLNKAEIEKVTGIYGTLEVINSGSFTDLDHKTMQAVLDKCLEKKIGQLHFECHWMHRDKIKDIKKFFREYGITVKIKIGVETFDALFRESYLDKGITADTPQEIAAYYDECCLLFGIPGQNKASMEQDILTGLTYFERVCINIMNENSKPVKPAPAVIGEFVNELLPVYLDNPRIDILIENTDFGVGDK